MSEHQPIDQFLADMSALVAIKRTQAVEGGMNAARIDIERAELRRKEYADYLRRCGCTRGVPKPKPRQESFTAEELALHERARRLRGKGWGYKSIAKKLGVTVHSAEVYVRMATDRKEKR